MNKDLDHLKLLGILHTIWGILTILFGLLFGIMYIGIGAAAAASPNTTTDDSGMSSRNFRQHIHCAWYRVSHRRRDLRNFDVDGRRQASEAARLRFLLFRCHRGSARFPEHYSRDLHANRT